MKLTGEARRRIKITMQSRVSLIIVGVLIPVVAIIAGFTNKEIRCLLRLDSEKICQSNLVNIDLVVRNKKYEPIEGVEVQFLSQGAPEVQRTGTTGYATIQIPTRRDIEITLSKEGYETLNQIINMDNPFLK